MSRRNMIIMANDPMKDALAGYGSPRVPMGTSAYSLANSPGPSTGTKPKYLAGGAGQDIGAGTAVNRAFGPRTGAKFRITAKTPAFAPDNANTQANGRIVPPTHRRGKNFWSQAAL